MLVLTRKAGEGILLNQDVTIEILSVEGDRVRIGINAPKDMRIFRRELLEETICTNQEAAKAPVINIAGGQ
jgi:carbon storage regulator